jgi:hypothetical protein
MMDVNGDDIKDVVTYAKSRHNYNIFIADKDGNYTSWETYKKNQISENYLNKNRLTKKLDECERLVRERGKQ